VYQEDVEIVPPPPPATRKGNKEKKVSRRGGRGGVTKEEDAILCSTFLNISKDPLICSQRTKLLSLTQCMFWMLLYRYELSLWIICRCQLDLRRLLQMVP
jgi:hypothetical protein